MLLDTIEVGERLAPPLKWAGGKRWQVPHVTPLYVVVDRM